MRVRGPVEVLLARPVGEDDGRAVAAEFQGAVLARHRVHDRVADLVGAGEGDDRQPLVLDEGGHAVVGHRQDAPGAGGQLGLGEQLAEDQRGQRGGRGRLEDDRGAGGEGRGDLVGAQVEREVEGGDAEDGALGEAAGQGEPALAAGVGVQALGLAAVEAAGLLGGEPEHGDGAADLAAGPLDRLAVLGGDQPGDLLGRARRAVGRRGRGRRRARGRGWRRTRLADGVRGGDGLLDLGPGRQGDGADEPAVPGGGDVEGLLAGGLAAGEPEGVGGGHGRGACLPGRGCGPFRGLSSGLHGRARRAGGRLSTVAGRGARQAGSARAHGPFDRAVRAEGFGEGAGRGS